MSTAQTMKRLVVGPPMASGKLEHTLLPKILALPVFSSDPLSSVAYATQEIMIVLSLAGAAALTRVVPISFAVAALLFIVVISYRQTVRAYPRGGGAYIVARENLGTYPGLLAAAALQIDYILTVSVSITAGVEAIVSAMESLDPYRVQLCVALIVFVTLANLRGTRESGTLFAIPTYGFVVAIYALLITGAFKCLGGCPEAATASEGIHAEVAALSPLLLLRAFSAGTTALTGVEAISDGVPAFRYPQSRNAATTLAIMGFFSISMFLGISVLASATGVRFQEGDHQTVVAQIAHTVFGGGVMFYVVQTMTALILILAANTAYQDFPRLSSILARDRFMPRQLMNRGDRLVFSNGIVILAVLASLLVWVFEANLTSLIQLYLVGVFISFTLSQSGMVVHWRRSRERGWKRSTWINGFGACVTGVVLIVVVRSKFLEGAWIVVTAIPVLMFLMREVHRHYSEVAEALAHPGRLPAERRPLHQHVVIFVRDVDAATARALGYVHAMSPSDVVAVTLNDSCVDSWHRLAADIPIEVIRNGGSDIRALKRVMAEKRGSLEADHFLTLVVPELLERRGALEILRRPFIHRLKASFLTQEGIQVMDVPVLRDQVDVADSRVREPARNFVVVLVAGMHNATLQAIEYGETLQPTDIRAVSFGLDPEATERLGDEWLDQGVPIPLEIEDSPFRDIGHSLGQYLKRFKADGVTRVVTVVLPEFIVPKRRHQILHGQTALLVKSRVLFLDGVVTVSVPYRI